VRTREWQPCGRGNEQTSLGRMRIYSIAVCSSGWPERLRFRSRLHVNRIDWLQTSAFPLGRRFPAHPDIEHWFAHSGVFLRRSLLAAAAAILCGPEVFRILNGVLRFSLHMSWTGLHNFWLHLPDWTKADLLMCSSSWPEGLRSELTRMSISPLPSRQAANRVSD